ncbi:hypothetical protein K0M31_015778 [Melipona bicolor]|uniref:Uncharacterized protein n=1 Tax=Melipona bicolor TaxID=60889 RepID=A0AA40FEY4_9HYME|nr:hypothetical protein K0M31_015778 [Melipona bicolor]
MQSNYQSGTVLVLSIPNNRNNSCIFYKRELSELEHFTDPSDLGSRFCDASLFVYSLVPCVSCSTIWHMSDTSMLIIWTAIRGVRIPEPRVEKVRKVRVPESEVGSGQDPEVCKVRVPELCEILGPDPTRPDPKFQVPAHP